MIHKKAEDGSWAITLGDCVEVLPKMFDTADAIVVDPPYGINYQSAWRTDKATWKPKVKNDTAPFTAFLPGAFAALRPVGCCFVFCRWDTAETFRAGLEAVGFSVKSQVVWDRVVHGMGDLCASFSPRHDLAWFATKGSGWRFPGKRPASVLRHQRVSGEALVHPNEKPLALMEEIVGAICPPGGVVLDPCMGSGTTGIATIRLGRRFLGCELDEAYFRTAALRLEKETIACPTRTSYP